MLMWFLKNLSSFRPSTILPQKGTLCFHQLMMYTNLSLTREPEKSWVIASEILIWIFSKAVSKTSSSLQDQHLCLSMSTKLISKPFPKYHRITLYNTLLLNGCSCSTGPWSCSFVQNDIHRLGVSTTKYLDKDQNPKKKHQTLVCR